MMENGKIISLWPRKVTDGKKYVGESENGIISGRGEMTWPTGEKYIGDFKDFKHHGGEFSHSLRDVNMSVSFEMERDTVAG